MRYLLDTCVVMNMIAEPDRLCPNVEVLIGPNYLTYFHMITLELTEY